MGPVIFGRAERGPSLRPVRVGSYSEFVEIFGNPKAGGEGDDVWRNGGTWSCSDLWRLCCTSLFTK